MHQFATSTDQSKSIGKRAPSGCAVGSDFSDAMSKYDVGLNSVGLPKFEQTVLNHKHCWLGIARLMNRWIGVRILPEEDMSYRHFEQWVDQFGALIDGILEDWVFLIKPLEHTGILGALACKKISDAIGFFPECIAPKQITKFWGGFARVVGSRTPAIEIVRSGMKVIDQ